MNLFQRQNITLHSGSTSEFKIECDALTDDDLETLAFIGSKLVGPFKYVRGVPSGGVRFAQALEPYSDPSSQRALIVDDVMTTGNSMNEFWESHKSDFDGLERQGLVIFDRSDHHSIPYHKIDWISSILRMNCAF